MVCSVGSGRMAVMARLLASGNLSQTFGEEIGQHKLAAQCIYRELCEADEANLLDEEDMHVFGLKPMADSLDLVCCNACKKPVKTSQYTAHAEETILELDGSTGHKKPPRKERKKLLTAYINQATPVARQERFISIDADDTAASESRFDGQIEKSYPFSMDTKRNFACDVASMMDNKGVSPENTDHSAYVMPPPTKRSKLASSEHLSFSNDPEAASGLTKIISTQDTFTSRGFQRQSTSGNDMPNDCVVVSKFLGQAHGCCLPTKDIPAPLATKIYYSQRNNRLRAAVARMYYESSAKGLSSNVLGQEVSQETIIQLQASSHRDYSHEQVDERLNQKMEPSVCTADQILAQSSEACVDKSGVCLSATNFSDQFSVDNILRPQTAPVGFLRGKYISKPYSFAGSSGQSLGSMQQSGGRVPVL